MIAICRKVGGSFHFNWEVFMPWAYHVFLAIVFISTFLVLMDLQEDG